MWQGVELCIKLSFLSKINETETLEGAGSIALLQIFKSQCQTLLIVPVWYTLCIPHNQPTAVRKSFVIDSLLKNKEPYYFSVNGGSQILFSCF